MLAGGERSAQIDLYKRTNFIAYTTGGIGMYWLIDRLSGII